MSSIEIQKACDETRKRMSSYTKEQRDELERKALEIMFPNGYTTCAKDHVSIYIDKTKPCPQCDENKI